MERTRTQVTSAALVGALGLLLAAQEVPARSAGDLLGRIVVDGRVDDWDPADRVFRLCDAASPADSCRDEEGADDSAWSALQELHQIYVTWDARRLYLAVTGQIDAHALLLLLDTEDGEHRDLTSLEHWRRAVRFGPEMGLDVLLALRDGQRQPELWRLPAGEAMQPIDPEVFEAVSAFEVGATEVGLEAAIPWSVLFPGAPRAVNPDSLAPAEPMFVLPASSARRGLRLLAAVVHAEAGLGAADLAPDGRELLSLDPRTPVRADRVVHVDWSEAAAGAPHFVRFDFAVQEQGPPRFLPDAPGTSTAVAAQGFTLEMTTERAGSGEPTRLVVPDRDLDIAFALHVQGEAPGVLYVSSRILSLRGETIVELAADVPVSCAGDGSPCRDVRFRWDGRDAAGSVSPGGAYVWRVDVGPGLGTRSLRLQRSIAVVH